MAKALRRGKKNGEKENIHDFMTVSDCHRVSSLFAVGDETDHSKDNSSEFKTAALLPTGLLASAPRSAFSHFILVWSYPGLPSAPVMQTGLGNAGSEACEGFPLLCVLRR